MCSMSECIFCKIRDGEIPADIVHDDPLCLAFRDIHPAAPVHVVLIPKEHLATLDDARPTHEGLLGHLVTVAGELARKLGVAESGYRLVANCHSDGGQEVFHLHVHLLGGRKLGWPPG